MTHAVQEPEAYSLAAIGNGCVIPAKAGIQFKKGSARAGPFAFGARWLVARLRTRTRRHHPPFPSSRHSIRCHLNKTKGPAKVGPFSFTGDTPFSPNPNPVFLANILKSGAGRDPVQKKGQRKLAVFVCLCASAYIMRYLPYSRSQKSE